MATIKEVAQKARVSVGTVSNVISGTVPVSNKLKNRVLAVIKQLDYYPDHVARSLKVRHTRTIGLVISDITDPFYPQIMRGAEDAAWSANYILITFNSDDQPQREQHALDALRSRRVDGILLVAATGTDPSRIRAIHDSGTPVVCLDREISGAGLDCVVVNHFRAARNCVRHLVSNGHTGIGLLNAGPATTVARDRYQGYRQGLEDAGIAVDDRIVMTVGATDDDALQGAKDLLASAPRPSAVLAFNLRAVIGMLRALREMDLRCPDDLALMIFDDPVFSEAVTPPLSAVAQPSYDLGHKGVELLLQRMEDPKRRRRKLVLESTLRVRESCGAHSRAVG
jgi:LacI family transcriptional regulator